jgi:class 3 adenylate cyclase
LPWICSACSGENPPDKRFCGDCGAAREATARPGPGAPVALPERRLVSVMFVDLVGSTALGLRLDPEDLRDAINAFHAHVTSLVACFQGFVALHMGDGLLVYFGYPQAHEADAERAVRAGLAIIDAVPRLNTAAGPPGTLNVRIGIATGLVIVGDLIGFGSSREANIVGDTPNLAARLQTAAEPGCLIISDATQLLVGNLFEYGELTLTNLRGRPAPERAWMVLRESTIDSRYQALRSGRLALVDRTEELEFLVRRWEQAKTGEGRVVLLTGDPGIGKSRLIEALAQFIGAPHQCVRFVCSPHHLDTPLHPVIRHMESAAGIQRGDTPAAKFEKLSKIPLADSSADDRALLADLLSIALPESDALAILTPQRRKVMTFDAILRYFASFARRGPTLILMEDLHWADPTTLDLLNLLVEAAQQLPLFLLVTARPEMRPAWTSRPHVALRVLSGLEDRHATDLIRQVTAGRELPGEVIDRIIAHADSVPLFIEELTKTVVGAAFDKDQQSGPPMGTLSADAVPTSLYSSLISRLDRLTFGKEAARTASVIGREFSFHLLQAVSQQPAKSVEDALSELAQAEIIVSHGVPPAATYTFRHALVQDAAYASLLRDQRQAIHRRLAEVLETEASGDAAEPQVLAWHFAEAGAPDRSVHYYQKAAERATGRFALAEMVHHLRNGLRQIKLMPESTDRHRRELALQLDLGRALIDHEGANSEGVCVAFERALELCLALDEVELLPRVYDGLVVNYHYIRSQPDAILQYIDRMHPVHQRLGERRALFMRKRAECLAELLLGNFAPASERMQSLIEMYDPAHDGPEAGMSTRDPKVSMYVLLGICLTILGRCESGTAMSRAAVEHAERLGHPVSLNLALRRACAQAMLQKDARRVAELAGRMADVRSTYETYKGSWEGTFFQDWTHMCTHPDPVVFDRIRVFLYHLDAAKNWALLPLYIVSTVEVSARSSDPATIAKLLNRAAEIIELTGSRWCEAEVGRLRAQFCARDADESLAMLRSSLATARQQGAKLWELRAATDMARLLRVRGDDDAARETLAPVYASFSEESEMPDIVTARALLEGLGAT